MKDILQTLLNEHKAECVCGAIAVVVLGCNAGSIKEFIAKNNELREAVKTEQQDNQRLQVQELVSEQRREVANDRYQNNCTMIFSLNQQGHYTAISDGDPVLKGELAAKYRNKKFNVLTLPKSVFLPSGMTICDAYGNTAKLVSDPNQNNLPVARDLANTGDQVLIKSAMDRAKGIYSNPVKN